VAAGTRYSTASLVKIRTISTSLTSSIVAMNHHSIVETNTRMIVQTTIIQTINEMNFEIDQMINFNQIVARKDALYVKNLIVDQSIIRKTSEMTRKSAFSIDTHSLETIIDFVSTF
jgi:hypothetical protein